MSLAKLQQKIREYEDRMAKASKELESARQGGGLSKEALDTIERALGMLS